MVETSKSKWLLRFFAISIYSSYTIGIELPSTLRIDRFVNKLTRTILHLSLLPLRMKLMISVGYSKSNNWKLPILLKYVMKIDPILKKKDSNWINDRLVLEHRFYIIFERLHKLRVETLKFLTSESFCSRWFLILTTPLFFYFGKIRIPDSSSPFASV